jgi:hypothetical protein
MFGKNFRIGFCFSNAENSSQIFLYGKLFQNSFHFPNISYQNGFSDVTPPVTLFKAKHKTLLKTKTVFTKHFSKNKTQCYKN